jgi:single-strand DNA-binding protein
MRGVNRVTLVGCLGHDPEIVKTAKTKMAKLSIATNASVKDEKGQWQERPEWHNVVLWDRLAEVAEQYLKKGSRVYIEGRLQTRSWEDKKTSEKKYRTEVIANEMVMLGDVHRTNSGDKGQASARGEAPINMDADECPV